MSGSRLIIVLLLCIAGALSSAANVTHHVRFAQPDMVMVWHADSLIGSGDTIRIAGVGLPDEAELPGSGVLISSASDARTSKTIRVASNTGFFLRSVESLPAGSVAIRVIEAGPNAQIQSRPPADSRILFQQSTRTAKRPGTPLSQAITLEISWRGNAEPGLVLSTR